MPIAVNHQDIVRHIVVLHVPDELLNVALRVGLVLAIPVAKHVFRRQRLPACNTDIVA